MHLLFLLAVLLVSCGDASDSAHQASVMVADSAAENANKNGSLEGNAEQSTLRAQDTLVAKKRWKDAKAFIGKWRLGDIHDIFEDPPKSIIAETKNLDNFHLELTPTRFVFSYEGMLGLSAYDCAYDSLGFKKRKYYGEKDMNPDYRGTSYWYGYRTERGLDFQTLHVICDRDRAFSFEIFDDDTLGCAEFDKVFLFVREKK